MADIQQAINALEIDDSQIPAFQLPSTDAIVRSEPREALAVRYLRVSCAATSRIPIRVQPSVKAETKGQLSPDEEFPVVGETKNCFFILADDKGYVNKVTKGISWIEIPPKILKLTCPESNKVPIRASPSVKAEIIGYLATGEEFMILSETKNSFFILADSRGFVNVATKGVSWAEINLQEIVGKMILPENTGPMKSPPGVAAVASPKPGSIPGEWEERVRGGGQEQCEKLVLAQEIFLRYHVITLENCFGDPSDSNRVELLSRLAYAHGRLPFFIRNGAMTCIDPDSGHFLPGMRLPEIAHLPNESIPLVIKPSPFTIPIVPSEPRAVIRPEPPTPYKVEKYYGWFSEPYIDSFCFLCHWPQNASVPYIQLRIHKKCMIRDHVPKVLVFDPANTKASVDGVEQSIFKMGEDYRSFMRSAQSFFRDDTMSKDLTQCLLCQSQPWYQLPTGNGTCRFTSQADKDAVNSYIENYGNELRNKRMRKALKGPSTAASAASSTKATAASSDSSAPEGEGVEKRIVYDSKDLVN